MSYNNSKALSKEQYKPNKDSKKWRYRDIWTDPDEFIDDICTIHGGDCSLSR